MKRTMWTLLPTLLAVALVATACASSDMAGSMAVEAPAESRDMAAAPGAGAVAPEVGGGANQAAAAAATPLPENLAVGGDTARKIIKDAALAIEVDSVGLGLSRIDGIAAQAGGYVVESRTDYADALRKRAFIKIGVPVDQFEVTLQRIREAAGKVLSESASGVDVSQEYVDVQSQIANLEATQARVRAFLDAATTVEEALQVNQRLTEIEGQLGQAKGRLQYLAQRSAFSNIAVELQEQEPPPTVTPTPTPRPAWQPGQTAGRAFDGLVVLMQGLVELTIWLVIVVLPVILIIAIPLLVIWWLIRGIRRRRAK